MAVAVSFPDQLRRQARHLVERDPRRPTQANLRRAISSAYYALFHLLVEDSSMSLLGAGSELAAIRGVVRRTYTHADMLKASRAFASGWGGLPAGVHTSNSQPKPPGQPGRGA